MVTFVDEKFWGNFFSNENIGREGGSAAKNLRAKICHFTKNPFFFKEFHVDFNPIKCARGTKIHIITFREARVLTANK